MTDRNVASIVKGCRDRAGLSQSQAARELGVSLKTLQGWEQGRPMPYPRLLAFALLAWEGLAEDASGPSQKRDQKG
jgi:DNA-binding transcriptional regulator YiaG